MPVGWKVLNHDGTPFHGGTGRWSLPTKNPNGSWTPGEWMIEKGPLRLCEPGTLHLCKSIRHLLTWLGPAVFHVEYRGDVADGSDKIGVLEARLIALNENWNETTARLFAADCADAVLHLANDERCNNAVRVARQYAFGLCDAAAWAAARDAARAAARDAQTERLHAYLTGQVDLEAIRKSLL